MEPTLSERALETELLAKDAVLFALRRELRSLRSSVAEFEREAEARDSQMRNEKKNASLPTVKSERYENEKEGVGELREQLRAKQVEIDALKATKESTQHDLTLAKDVVISGLQAKLAGLSAELSAAKAQTRELTEALKAQHSIQYQLKVDLTQACDERDHARVECDRSRQQIKDQPTSQHVIASEGPRTSNVPAIANPQMEAPTTQICDELNAALPSKDTGICELKRVIHQKDAELRNLKMSLEAKDTALSDQLGKAKQMEISFSSLTKKNELLRSKLNLLLAEGDEYIAVTQRATSELERLRNTCSQLQAKHSFRKNELLKSRTTIADLQRKLAEMNGKHERELHVLKTAQRATEQILLAVVNASNQAKQGGSGTSQNNEPVSAASRSKSKKTETPGTTEIPGRIAPSQKQHRKKRARSSTKGAQTSTGLA